MGLFSNPSPFEGYVEKATSEKNTNDDWAQIMDVCDRINATPDYRKDWLKAILKRLHSDNPRVALQAITLLDSCVNNCGKSFHLEVGSRDFEQEIKKIITGTKIHPKVSTRMKQSLKLWAEGEFKADSELGLIPSLYAKLLKEGHDFESTTDSPKKTVKYSNDPNVVNDEQEEEDIAKAIQLSLLGKDSNSHSSTQKSATSASLYSSASAALSSESSPSSVPQKEPRKVRALYDFEAAEDNELSFKAGEIILVLDDSYENWWRGSNHRGEGLFPSNFVTSELEEDEFKTESYGNSGKKVSFSDRVEVTEVEDAPSITSESITGEIDEEKIDRLMHLLHEADPTGERPDHPELNYFEEQVNAMAPNIDTELENIDKKHAELARISNELVEALNLYHQFSREIPATNYYGHFNSMSPIPHHQPPNTAPPPMSQFQNVHMAPGHYMGQPTGPMYAMYGPQPPHVMNPGDMSQNMPPGAGAVPHVSGVPTPGGVMSHPGVQVSSGAEQGMPPYNNQPQQHQIQSNESSQPSVHILPHMAQVHPQMQGGQQTFSNPQQSMRPAPGPAPPPHSGQSSLPPSGMPQMTIPNHPGAPVSHFPSHMVPAGPPISIAHVPGHMQDPPLPQSMYYAPQIQQQTLLQ